MNGLLYFFKISYIEHKKIIAIKVPWRKKGLAVFLVTRGLNLGTTENVVISESG